MDKQKQIYQMPKVELHCHLDGSLSLQAMEEILKKSGEPIPTTEELQGKMRAPENVTNLADYLACFDFVLSHLQTESALEIAGYDIVRQAADDNVRYLEVRFAPLLFCKKGLRPRDAIQAVLKGLERGSQEFSVKTASILCMMRQMTDVENRQVLELASEFLGHGVCAVDLAGDEAAYPMNASLSLFERANELQIPYTVHAGECSSVENVRQAIKIGARRIGHGISTIMDDDLITLCRNQNIFLEVCPTCNVQTKIVENIEQHPFYDLNRMGVRIGINTDNRTVSNMTLSEEYVKVAEVFNYSLADLHQFTIHAVEAAFINAKERQALLMELGNYDWA